MNLLQDIEPVLVRHHHIQKNQIKIFRLQFSQSFGAVLSQRDLVVGIRQQKFQVLPDG